MINQEANTKLTNENILTLSIQLVLQQYSFISSNIIISVVEIDSEYVLHECVLLSSKNASMCLSRQKPDNREEETVIKILALQFYLQLALWNSLRRGEERRGEERRGEERYRVRKEEGKNEQWDAGNSDCCSYNMPIPTVFLTHTHERTRA